MSLSHAQRQRLDQIAKGRSDERLFLLEGRRAVRDALAAGHVAELWVRTDFDPAARDQLVQMARAAGVPVGEGSRKDFDRLGKTVTPQGVFALVHDTELPLDDVAGLAGMLLWLDGLQDPGNVGAVVRVAAAFGAAGVVASMESAHPLGLKALRASAGLALSLPFTRAPSAGIAQALAGQPVYVLERGGEDVFALEDVPRDFVLVVGSEGKGPGAEAEAAATRRLGIPIDPDVDSLNAAVATGIAVAALRHAAGRRA